MAQINPIHELRPSVSLKNRHGKMRDETASVPAIKTQIPENVVPHCFIASCNPPRSGLMLPPGPIGSARL